MDSIEAIVELLTKASQAYYNGGDLLMDDESYDSLLETLRERDPENIFLLNVGATPSSVHPLPVRMPSLDKIKLNEKRLERFLSSATEYVFSEKLDGLSALWIPAKQQLFLRGNGVEGYLIPSSMVPHIQGLVQSTEQWIIRGELIMKRSKDLINGRNIVNGLLHHKTPDKKLLGQIEFLAYEVHNPTGLKRSEQFAWLLTQKFLVPWWEIIKAPSDYVCSTKFTERRANSLYDTDGIVVGVNQVPIHSLKAMTGPIQNPKDCVAFKMPVSDQSATTTIKEVIWAASAQGYLIPKIRFDPIVINGATIEYCTGHNARTIVDKVLGPGALIKIRRSGDVIPTLDSVIVPALVPSLPSPLLNWEWNGAADSATHICVTSVSEEQKATQLYHFAKTLDIQGLGPASATSLVGAGYKTPCALWEASEADLCKTLGPKTGKTLYANLRTLQASPSLTEMALILASNQIPRGTGEAKLCSLFKNVPDPRQWTSTSSIPSGWTEETFKAFQESFKNYEAWRAKELYWIPYPILPKTAAAPIASKGLVCFTGFRNKALEESLKAKGYELAQSLTSSVKILVTSDDSTSESAKIKKARESKTVEVIACSEFVKKYLS
jgi:DNA ligase (NAD+)